MNAKRLLSGAVVSAGVLLLACAGASAWQTGIDGTASGTDVASTVRVDAAGDVVAAGTTTNVGTNADFTVVKLSGADGREVWRRVINGTANSGDGASDVAVDAAGDVIAAGVTVNTGTTGDFMVVKLSGADGTELWRREINGTANSQDHAFAVAVDRAGDVVAAGYVHNATTSLDFFVIKFDGQSGAERWRQSINGSANGIDEARAVAVDAAGDVIAAGETANVETGSTFTVVKLSGADGTELWRQTISGSATGVQTAFAVAVDAAGDVAAAGITRNVGTQYDFTVVKLAGADGYVIWRRDINGSANFHDFAYAVAVDPAGDVLAAGVTINIGTFADFTVVKLAGADGAELWRQVINGTANEADQALAITVDRAGDVVASGSLWNIGTFGQFAVVKLAGADGAELWRQTLSGTTPGSSEARAVVVDAAGDVVAAGGIFNGSSNVDFAVVKLRGNDGGDF